MGDVQMASDRYEKVHFSCMPSVIHEVTPLPHIDTDTLNGPTMHLRGHVVILDVTVTGATLLVGADG